jgi:uncharacterized protein
MITAHTFSSLLPWKNLLITGAIHGNEHCWTLAIFRIIDEIEQGVIKVLQWSVTFIPICNPEGFKKNKRLIEENLARIFDYYETPNSYEKYCATIIAPYIDRCDILLDIHSGNAKNSKFVFQDIEDWDSYYLASNLWFDLVVHGRPDMYPDDGAKDPSSYAHKQWKTAVVIECGQHNDPEAEGIAYHAIKNFLYHYWLIAEWWKKSDTSDHVIMKKLVYMEKESVGTFAQERKNGDLIKKWELIWSYEDGQEIVSDLDGYILLPKHNAQAWNEWFYLAVKNTVEYSQLNI